MTNNQNPKYDLEERTAQFGENIIKFCSKLPKTTIVTPLIIQLIKAGTSIGANYSEADDAESKQDFRHKVGICKKESRESKHFLRMMAVAVPQAQEDAKLLWQEANGVKSYF